MSASKGVQTEGALEKVAREDFLGGRPPAELRPRSFLGEEREARSLRRR